MSDVSICATLIILVSLVCCSILGLAHFEKEERQEELAAISDCIAIGNAPADCVVAIGR